jgi:hypothetical protein
MKSSILVSVPLHTSYAIWPSEKAKTKLAHYLGVELFRAEYVFKNVTISALYIEWYDMN